MHPPQHLAKLHFEANNEFYLQSQRGLDRTNENGPTHLVQGDRKEDAKTMKAHLVNITSVTCEN